MRELKFRAWDEADGLHRDKGEMSYGITDISCDATVIMQYTGFDDKHKREIYDGDVLKRAGDTYLIIWKLDRLVCRKIYDSWLESNVINRCFDISLTLMVTFDIEIIGNVYENPELLINKNHEQ